MINSYCTFPVTKPNAFLNCSFIPNSSSHFATDALNLSVACMYYTFLHQSNIWVPSYVTVLFISKGILLPRMYLYFMNVSPTFKHEILKSFDDYVTKRLHGHLHTAAFLLLHANVGETSHAIMSVESEVDTTDHWPRLNNGITASVSGTLWRRLVVTIGILPVLHKYQHRAASNRAPKLHKL